MTASSCSIACIFVFGILIGPACGTTHTVTYSDTALWTGGVGVSYPDLTITVGETLKFVSYSHHDVALLHAPSSGTHWDLCGMEGIPSNNFTTVWAASEFAGNAATEKHYSPPTCGDFYIACSVPPHCAYGQRVKVTVNNADGSACSSPCLDAACVTTDSKLTVASGTVHDVKPAPNSRFWGSSTLYDALTVEIGDTVLFQTGAGYHDVATVPTQAELNSCEMSSMTLVADWDFASGMTSAACNASSTCCAGTTCGLSGSYVTYTFTAETAGDTYFVCSIGGGSHCQTGQKFILTTNAPNLPPPVTSYANDARRWHVYRFLVIVGLMLGVQLSFTAC